MGGGGTARGDVRSGRLGRVWNLYKHKRHELSSSVSELESRFPPSDTDVAARSNGSEVLGDTSMERKQRIARQRPPRIWEALLRQFPPAFPGIQVLHGELRGFARGRNPHLTRRHAKVKWIESVGKGDATEEHPSMNVIRLGIDKEELCESIPPNESP